MPKVFLIIIFYAMLLAGCSQPAVQKDGAMTSAQLGALIEKVDKEAVATPNSYVFTVNKREIMMVFDENADRMRLITPIAPAASVSEDVYIRMLQANYDAALDARYAVANDMIWAVFIHPLSNLTDDLFLSGIAQSYTAAETFGSSYTSGAFVFGGGDSNAIHEDLLKDLEEATGLDGTEI